MAQNQRLVIGISGASGASLGIRLLQACQKLELETHLVISKAGEITIAQETNKSVSEVKALASHTHKSADIGAAIASGSFQTMLSEMGAIIAPPVPAFYTKPETTAEIVDQFTGHLLRLMGIDNDLAREWTGLKGGA